MAEIEAGSGKVDEVQGEISQIIPELKAKIEMLQKVHQELILSRDQEEAKTVEATKRVNIEIDKADKLDVEIVELKAELRRSVQEIKYLQEVANLTEAVKQAHSLEFYLKRVGECLDENNQREHKCAKYDWLLNAMNTNKAITH